MRLTCGAHNRLIQSSAAFKPQYRHNFSIEANDVNTHTHFRTNTRNFHTFGDALRNYDRKTVYDTSTRLVPPAILSLSFFPLLRNHAVIVCVLRVSASNRACHLQARSSTMLPSRDFHAREHLLRASSIERRVPGYF